jgi:hypothetical protein
MEEEKDMEISISCIVWNLESLHPTTPENTV